jgi:TetR/AcrR family transcriptional regulator
MTTDLQTEEKILIAAEEEFLEQGFTGARLQKIADSAGLNKALLHYYFRSKDRLFEVVFEKIASQIISQLLEKITSETTFFEKIRFFFDYHISAIENNQRLPLFVINEIARNPERLFQLVKKENVLNVKEILERQLNDEIERGIIRPIELEELILNCVSLSVFNFIAKPMFMEITGTTNKDFSKFLKHRKTSLADFVINSIKL